MISGPSSEGILHTAGHGLGAGAMDIGLFRRFSLTFSFDPLGFGWPILFIIKITLSACFSLAWGWAGSRRAIRVEDTSVATWRLAHVEMKFDALAKMQSATRPISRFKHSVYLATCFRLQLVIQEPFSSESPSVPLQNTTFFYFF
eukprot:m.113931 g.113931  ORF g.113931 m.113931 type:complete len:145 (+) comp14402_c0_seq3:840-1274(+)